MFMSIWLIFKWRVMSVLWEWLCFMFKFKFLYYMLIWIWLKI